MERLRILHLMSARYYVGEAARVVDLVQGERERGHDSRLIIRAGSPVAHEAGRRGLPYAEATLSGKFVPWHDYADVRLVKRLVAERDVDVVHAHRGKDHWLAAWALLGKRRPVLVRSRHVVTPIRDHLPNRWLYERATRGVIAVSDIVRAQVERLLAAGPERLRTIRGGGRLDRLAGSRPEAVEALRRRLHLEPDRVILTLLARVAPIKGHEHVLSALPEILARQPRAVVVFAYSRQGDYRRQLDEQVNRLGLREAVRWIGPQDDLSPLLALTDVGLIASVGSEGWSRVAVEFQAAGKPVVATTVGSLPEIIYDGQNGFLVPPADPAAMAAAVNRLLADSALRLRLGQAARAEAEQYHYLRLTDETIQFYRDLLA